jgi:SAM-dependent methyltransferase
MSRWTAPVSELRNGRGDARAGRRVASPLAIAGPGQVNFGRIHGVGDDTLAAIITTDDDAVPGAATDPRSSAFDGEQLVPFSNCVVRIQQRLAFIALLCMIVVSLSAYAQQAGIEVRTLRRVAARRAEAKKDGDHDDEEDHADAEPEFTRPPHLAAVAAAAEAALGGDGNASSVVVPPAGFVPSAVIPRFAGAVRFGAVTLTVLNTPHPPAHTVGGDGETMYRVRPSDATSLVAVPRGGPTDPYARSCPYLPLRLKGRRPDDRKLMTAIAKYTNYVNLYCNSSGMLQMFVPFDLYLSILDKIARIIGLQENDRILDFGSGCGTTLNYYGWRFNTTGTGVDLTAAAVGHAVAHAWPNQLFCHAEGAHFLSLLPENYFDQVVSWSVIHHIRRKQHQCATVAAMVRVVKPGGYVFVGHLRGEHTLDFWVKKRRCNLPGATYRVLTDYKVFGIEAFRRNRYPSVLVRKMTEAEIAAQSVGVPMAVVSSAPDDDEHHLHDAPDAEGGDQQRSPKTATDDLDE